MYVIASRLWVLLLIIFLSMPLPAAALEEPDISSIPAFVDMQKAGTKFYFLGEYAGHPGWLIIRQERVQMLYLAADRKGFFLGALHAPDGVNVTMMQVAALVKRNPEVAAIFAKQKNVTEDKVDSGLGDKLLANILAANGVMLGDAKAPLLHMVIDPHCPYCKATWKELRDDVAAKRLQVHLIPIGAEGSDNEREAARFLEIDAPLENWNKFIDGDKAVLAGIPDPAKLEAVRANHRTIDEWKIQHTPYLVYRGKDGRVKIVQGQPDNIASVLADLQP